MWYNVWMWIQIACTSLCLFPCVYVVFMLSHMPVWVCGPLGSLGSTLFCRLRPLWETLQVRTGRDEDGGGATEVFLGSFPAISRDLGFLPVQSQIQILFLSDGPGQSWQLGLQAPVHPTCNSFLPPQASHLEKKESDGRRGVQRKIVIFSSQRWTEVTLQLERKPNTASSSLSENTERRGQRERGGNQSGSMWEMEVKSGKDRDQHPEHPSVPLLTQTTLQSPILGSRLGEMGLITSEYKPCKVS